MSNGGYSFWNGQPVNAPVYPQMGDLMQPTGQSAGGSGGGASAGYGGQMPGQMAYSSAGAAPSPQGHSQRGMGMSAGMAGMGMQMPMPSSQMGMGDYGHGNMPMSGTVSSPLTCNLPQSFFGQGTQGPYEPCIDNGEAFCAYNGMDMSMNYGGGGAGGSMSGGKGFW
ncbi:hypothetical protein KR074_008528 [Drosophila pseudoananassae]|nr:hypothetical protein KR074_008528 [Drosophila pseudoananassae]